MNTAGDRTDQGGILADLLGLPSQGRRGEGDVEAAFVGRYGSATDLQVAVMDTVRSGSSCLVIAPTASGKTEAAVIPLLELQRRTGQRILYVSPTRALINDVVARLESGFAALGLSVLGRHGESKRTPSAYSRAACVVLTPESLEASLESRAPWLAHVGFVVLDELHSIHGSPRGTQLRFVLTRLQDRYKLPLLVVALSATIPAPNEVAGLWGGEAGSLRVIRAPASVNRHDLAIANDGETGLRRWLARRDAPAKVLVFTNSRRRCDELFLALRGASDHVPLIHYSYLERSIRVDTERLLRELPRVVCIATSTLELGIDIGDINAVALADAPWSTRNLLQRIGRGGRRLAVASATTFPGSDRELLRTLACLSMSVEEDDDGVAPAFYSVLVQQALVMIAGHPRRRVKAKELVRAGRLTQIGHDDAASAILEHLRQQGTLLYSGAQDSYELTPAAERLLDYERFGNFPVDRGGWDLRTAGHTLAKVQLAPAPRRGATLLFAGRAWRVVGVARRIVTVVEDPSATSGQTPVYHDASPFVSARLAEAMGEILAGKRRLPDVQMAPEAEQRLRELQSAAGLLVDRGVLATVGRRGPRILTFAGSRANRLLATQMPASIGSDELGIDLSSPMTNVHWRRLVDGIGATEIAQRSWRALADSVATNKWLEYLPAELQYEEVMSQLVSPRVEASLQSVLRRDLVQLPGAGSSL